VSGGPGIVSSGRGIAAVQRLRFALPEGQTLPDDVWRRRHRWLLMLLWGQAVGLTAFALSRDYTVGHSLQEGGIVAAVALLATLAGNRKRLAATLVSFGLITCSAVLVHIWGGVIEAHFHFFVMIVILSLYEDWLPFLLAFAYVVVHHGVMGVADASSVYNHPDALAHPWKWAGIHGLFVLGAGVGSVLTWRLNEDVRAETRDAYAVARESEQRFRSAFDEAPIGMALASLDPGEEGRFTQVNRALCEITGFEAHELLTKSFMDITHPDDRAASDALSQRLRRGEISRFQADKRYIRADGRIVCVLVNVTVVRDGTGRPLHTIGQIQDITERKRTQERLAYQAYHDQLTGLANRRSLLRDLEDCLSAADPRDPRLLLLFDLDGFKAYNDLFGHAAGDAMLTRIGSRLDSAVDGTGRAYRMGGDEFCVLAPVGGDEPDIARLAAAALREHGEAFDVGVSYGSVLLPVEAADPTEALRRADQRMYARKANRRTSPGRQATDALLRAVAECSSDLGVHLHDVTDLCDLVSRRLGVPAEDMAPLLQAAALHDVGKVAIPDTILEKPGPLDEAEWGFMRKHTLIGERIVAAAPALSQAARIVRSTHECFDGSGYPDGLEGEEIPLAARIIAVCDAYDAMTSDRRYRSAMSHEGAVSELRRHSGSQFDPRVVEVFVQALVAGRHRTAA
jgi:PAS domain S-box-containing protein/diguanylate cyclase (GGDEF)-like protein